MAKLLSALVVLSVAASLLFLAACSESGDGSDLTPATSSTTTESSTAPSPTVDDDVRDREDDLRQAATEAVQAYIRGDAAQSYTYLAADYRERCPYDDYLGLLLFAGLFLGDISEAEASVEGIRFEGEQAFVDTRIELNGVDLFGYDEEDEYPDYWILEDDE